MTRCMSCGKIVVMSKVSVTRNFRIPQEVLDRVKALALKRKWSINGWVVNTLERESRPRNKVKEIIDA